MTSNNNMQNILTYIINHGPSSATQIASIMGLSRNHISRYLNLLESKGELMKVRSGNVVYYSTDGSTPDNVKPNRRDQILTYIINNGPISTTQLASILDLDRTYVSGQLNLLESKGELMKVRSGSVVYYSTDGSIPDNAKLNQRDQILNCVINNGPITTKQVASILGLDRGNTSGKLNLLVSQGELMKTQVGKYVYFSIDGSTPTSNIHKSAFLNSKYSTEGSPTIRCTQCGNYSPPNVLYCSMCGSTLKRFINRIIPDDVKKAVWKRYLGKCSLCGASENLHFDHIIPVTKGGSNNEKNVQILCAQCNLKKSDSIE